MLTFFFTSSLNDGSDAGAEHLDELIEKIAAGDRDALASLYEQTNKSVYGFALSILKDTHDAQDVLQDCYLHIYSAAGSYRSQGKPMAWILTITRNLCLKCRPGTLQMRAYAGGRLELYPPRGCGIFRGGQNDAFSMHEIAQRCRTADRGAARGQRAQAQGNRSLAENAAADGSFKLQSGNQEITERMGERSAIT